MDELKDTQKTDSISQFIDVQSVRTNPFGDNRAGERAYRRAERIVAALNLLTNHVSSEEPIRLSIRTESISLLGHVLSLRDEMRSPQSQSYLSLQGTIRHLISLTRILSISGFVSIPNATTMIDALDELGHFLSASQKSILSESITISKDELLDVRGAFTPRFSTAQRSIKDIKDTRVEKDSDVNPVSVMTSVTEVKSNGRVSIRAQSIMEILRVSGSLGIRDIASNLPEYSEKMIQRELLELVSQGKIRKTGLKRWSKYSILA